MGRCSQLPLFRHFRQSGLCHVSSSCYTAAGDQRRLLSHLSNSCYSTNTRSPDFSNLPGARLPSKNISKKSPVLEITSKQASDAFQHCLNLVKQHDVDNFQSILTLPKKAHAEMFSVHALNVELAMIRDKIQSRGNTDTTGMYRLQFWKDALSSIYGGSPHPVPRQPIAIALCSFAPEASPQYLNSLVTARQQTIGDKPFSTVFEVCGYGARTAGSLIQLRADCLARLSTLDIEIYKEDIDKSATDIGGAFGVMNLIRSTLPLFTRGVVLLPLDLLSLNGLTPDKVYNKKQPEDVKHVVRDMVRVAESQLESGRKRASTLPRTIRLAFNPVSSVTSHLISTAKKLDYDIYSPYLQRRKPLLMWSLIYDKWLGRV